jgi:hypothetical protein
MEPKQDRGKRERGTRKEGREENKNKKNKPQSRKSRISEPVPKSVILALYSAGKLLIYANLPLFIPIYS